MPPNKEHNKSRQGSGQGGHPPRIPRAVPHERRRNSFTDKHLTPKFRGQGHQQQWIEPHLSNLPTRPDYHALGEAIANEGMLTLLHPACVGNPNVYKEVEKFYTRTESMIKSLGKVMHTKYARQELGLTITTQAVLGHVIRNLDERLGIHQIPALRQAEAELESWIEYLEDKRTQYRGR